MALLSVSPVDVQQMLAKDHVLLVDIRSNGEYAAEHIAQARHVPLAALANGGLDVGDAQTVIFHCQSGVRTRLKARTLQKAVPQGIAVYVMKGGLGAWKAQGLPVVG